MCSPPRRPGSSPARMVPDPGRSRSQSSTLTSSTIAQRQTYPCRPSSDTSRTSSRPTSLGTSAPLSGIASHVRLRSLTIDSCADPSSQFSISTVHPVPPRPRDGGWLGGGAQNLRGGRARQTLGHDSRRNHMLSQYRLPVEVQPTPPRCVGLSRQEVRLFVPGAISYGQAPARSMTSHLTAGTRPRSHTATHG